MIKFLTNILKSDTPESSKRLVGVLGSISLIVSMLIYQTDTLVNAVLVLSLGSLSITVVDKIINKKQEDEIR
jgi:hypothetical protein